MTATNFVTGAPAMARPRTRDAEHRPVSYRLVNLFFLCSLLPFLSPLPARSDVQLPAFAVASIIIAVDVLKGRFSFNWVEGVFLSVAIWSFCFVLPGSPFTVRERIGILFAFEIYYVVKKYAHLFSPRLLTIAVVVTITTSIVQLLRPQLYGAVAPLFLRTVKDLSEGGRGASGPSAEPSFLAAMALAHGLLGIYYYVVGRISRGTLRAVVLMSAASLLLSKSATGFIYFGIVAGIGAAYYLFRGMTVGHWVGLLVSIAVLVMVVLGPLSQSRGAVILQDLYYHPDRVLADASAQERVRGLTIGVLSSVRHPLGAGGGQYPTVANEMNRTYGLDRIFAAARRDTITGVLNAGGMYLTELGLVFVLFLGVILFASMRVEVFHLMFSVLALLFLLFSFSVTFPLTWLLLGLAARRDFLAALPIRRAA